MLKFKREGGGFLNKLINKLPVEFHIPTYQYCGPGTRLAHRLERGDPGINALDRACMQHDIAYSQSNDLENRHQADKVLENRAWERVKSKDSTLGEKAAAWAVTNAMKVKRKLGMGVEKRRRGKRRTSLKVKLGGAHKRRHSFRQAVLNRTRDALKKFKHVDVKEGARIALSAAKVAVKDAGGKRRIRKPRIIPIPKVGGFLPLIPIFAGLSALGGLAGGAAGIARAVKASKAAQRDLDEAQRHNKTMEAIALGKKGGDGLYLKPYRRGMGLIIHGGGGVVRKTKNC